MVISILLLTFIDSCIALSSKKEEDSEVECYWEKQPTGCTRAKCPFKHFKKRSDKERVKCVTCTPHEHKKEQNASVTISWSSSVRGKLFQLRFTEASDKGATSTIIIVRGVKGHEYTERHLQHDKKYDVTVSVQDSQYDETKCKRFSTLPGVPCEAFVFSSVAIHRDVALQWDNKSMSYCEKKQRDVRDTPTTSLKKVKGACGTWVLRNTSQYWEINVTYHLRGVKKCTDAAAIGICANGKIDLIPSIGQNRYFYGITFRKDEDGSSEICYIDAGIKTMKIKIKCASKYDEMIGFFFDSRLPQLVVIDVYKDCILHKTGKLNILEGTQLEYFPICALNKEGEVNIKLLTGSDIKQLPSCIKEIWQ